MNYIEYSEEVYFNKELCKAYKRLTIGLIVDALINHDENFINTELNTYIYCLDFPQDFYTELKKCKWEDWQGFINLYQYISDTNFKKDKNLLKGVTRAQVEIFFQNGLITLGVEKWIIHKIGEKKQVPKDFDKVWTETECIKLIELWKVKTPYREIAKVLNKTIRQCQTKVRFMQKRIKYSYLF